MALAINTLKKVSCPCILEHKIIIFRKYPKRVALNVIMYIFYT